MGVCVGGREEREGGREGGRKGGRKGGKEEGSEGVKGRNEGKEGGREGREGGREGRGGGREHAHHTPLARHRATFIFIFCHLSYPLAHCQRGTRSSQTFHSFSRISFHLTLPTPMKDQTRWSGMIISERCG